MADRKKPTRHLEVAAMLARAKLPSKPLPDEHIAIVELANGYRVEIVASKDGETYRTRAHHEDNALDAIRLAQALQRATGFEIRTFRREAGE